MRKDIIILQKVFGIRINDSKEKTVRQWEYSKFLKSHWGKTCFAMYISALLQQPGISW